MTFDEIEALVRAARARGVSTLEWSGEGASLRVVLAPASPAAPPARQAFSAYPLAPAQPDPPAVLSPSVGFFRPHSSNYGAPRRGDRVTPATIVAFVQAGPLLHPVRAGRDAVLGACLVEDGAPVGFGARLFALD